MLVVLPPGPAVRVGGGTPVAGLPLVKRIVLAGVRAGFETVLVHDAVGPAELLAGTPAARLTAAPPLERGRIVLLPANVVPQPGWLRALRETRLAPETAWVDSSETAVIETKEPARVLAAAAARAAGAEAVAGLRRPGAAPAGLDDTRGRFPLRTPADVPAAERWLLRSLIKRSEGFMSRHVERRISLALTRLLVRTGLTPDQMTLVSLLVGLAGAPFFLSAAPAWQLAGALLFLAHSILDGCDGEIARLKFMESRRGAVLDYWGDNLVHVAVFGCIAAGWSLAVRATWPLALGAVAILSSLGAAACVFRRTMLDAVPAAGAAATARIAEAMAHRDFIYVVVALAAFGRADWFLLTVAAGAPVFLGLLLWVGATRRLA